MERMSEISVVILCGGKGTRIGQLSKKIPKPLINVGGRPILWHVMKIYASQGFNNFILCLGYKGEKIKKYYKNNNTENWNIKFINTGVESTKSDRIKQVKNLIKSDMFFLAYGDDVADIKLSKLLSFHKRTNRIVTITAVRMISEFGIIKTDRKNMIKEFKEKPLLNKWINGGFMVVNKEIFNYLSLGELEKEVFEKLVKSEQICAYKHMGTWKAMNTLKDNIELNAMWNKGKAFWKIW